MGARSANFGSVFFTACAAGLMPIMSNTLPLRSMPSVQPDSQRADATIPPAVHRPRLVRDCAMDCPVRPVPCPEESPIIADG